MSEILTLASDFIERMSNPAYGIAVNEEYSLRFAQLLAQERAFAILSEEAERVRDPNALGAHGWLWFLKWARGHNLQLNGDLLLDLADRWASVFMQVLIIDVATRRTERWWAQRPSRIDEFPDEWLRALLIRSIRQERPAESREGNDREERPRDEQGQVRTGRAEMTLLALLQVGNAVTLDAAATILTHPWPGRERLVDFYRWRLSDLEPETRRVWEDHVGMERFE